MKGSELAYCGLNCQKCPVFIATVNNDNALRLRTASEWSKHYSKILKTIGLDNLKPGDINCHSCRSKDVHFMGCEKCSIRPCCQEKNLITCADCDEYELCNKLKDFFSFDVHFPAKMNLDKIRSPSAKIE